MKLAQVLKILLFSAVPLAAQEGAQITPIVNTAAIKLPADYEAIQQRLVEADSNEERYAVLKELAIQVPEINNVKLDAAAPLAAALANDKLSRPDSASIIRSFSRETATMRPEAREERIIAGPIYFPGNSEVPQNDITKLVRAIRDLNQTVQTLLERVQKLETEKAQK